MLNSTTVIEGIKLFKAQKVVPGLPLQAKSNIYTFSNYILRPEILQTSDEYYY